MVRVITSGRRAWVAAAVYACVMASVLPAAAVPAAAPQAVWTRQFGSLTHERGRAIAATADGVYVAGHTEGTITSQSSAGGADAFVRRFSPGGQHLWTRQFGTAAQDIADGVAATDDAVFVVGTTAGLLGAASFGGNDAFLRRYATDGTLMWTRQFGTSNTDEAYAVTASGSRVYVSGYTGAAMADQAHSGNFDAYVRTYDLQGNHLWTRQFGTSGSELANGVDATTTGVYVAGQVCGALVGDGYGGCDAYVRVYDLQGNSVWTRQFGTADHEFAPAISVSLAGVFVAGETYGTLAGSPSAGAPDGYIRRYNSAGAEDWTRQVGGAGSDRINDVSATNAGVIATGFTDTTVYGQTTSGVGDGFVVRYTAGGARVWARQFGTDGQDNADAAAPSATGVYVAGHAGGAFSDQTSVGGWDAFVRRYVSYRPDAAVSKSSSSGYAGNDIYNATGAGQTVSATVSRTRQQAFHLRASNDGDATDTIRFDGCAGTSRFPVSYYRGATNITAKVVDGTYRAAGVAPGASATIRAVLKVAAGAAVGDMRTCAVTISSVAQPTLTDTVRAKVEAKA